MKILISCKKFSQNWQQAWKIGLENYLFNLIFNPTSWQHLVKHFNAFLVFRKDLINLTDPRSVSTDKGYSFGCDHYEMYVQRHLNFCMKLLFTDMWLLVLKFSKRAFRYFSAVVDFLFIVIVIQIVAFGETIKWRLGKTKPTQTKHYLSHGVLGKGTNKSL